MNDKLIKNMDVLIEGNLIKQISKEPLVIAQIENNTIIDGKEMNKPIITESILCSVSSYVAVLLFILLTTTVQAQSEKNQDTTKVRDLSSPAAVGKQLESDKRSYGPKLDWYFLDSLDLAKERFYKKTGFKANLDYNSQIMGATDAVGNNVGASGVLRLYGKYDFVGRGTPYQGGLVFKIEHRHKYTENALREYGPIDLGYAGFLQSTYNNQGFRVTNLYWRQTFATDKVVLYAGFVDVTDWTDVYAVASPWTSFNNLVFATGSGSTGGAFPDGSLGLMVNAWLSKDIYVIGGMIDANGDATQIGKGFDTFFNQFETLKTLEFGYTPSIDYAFLKNVHVTLWQVDERVEAQTSSGWGISGSVSWALDDQAKFLPFIRGGWAKDGGSFYDASVSIGMAYNIAGPNTLGIGLNWNSPNADTFGVELDDQFSSEIFYKFNLTDHFEVTPNLQLLVNPALNPNSNFIAVFGLRGRIFI